MLTWSARRITHVSTVKITHDHFITTCSVLARNEEFSKIAVIKKNFTVLKKKIQLSVGGILWGKFRDIPCKSTV